MADISGYNIALAALSALVFLGLATPGKAATYDESRQAVVVTTSNWDTSLATVRAYERTDRLSPWQPVGESIKAVVGRHGLAWGRGLHAEHDLTGPQKKEGDGRAPAGIFPLLASFGYADSAAMKWIKPPYRQSTADVKCIDDPESAYYNRIVDAASVLSDWRSHEDMMRDDGQYRLGVVVGHNMEPAAPGGGSCIFLHIWKAPAEGTSGCTAVSEENMEALLRWLDPKTKPVLIQLPEVEYGMLRHAWNLP